MDCRRRYQRSGGNGILPTMATIRAASRPDLLLDRATLTPATGTHLYARLRRDVISAGILQRAHGYYVVLIGIITAGLTVSLVEVVRSPLTPLLVLWSVVLAVFAVQICGLIHDAGHR